MKKSKPVLHDPQILNRVKQYLEENVDKTYLDVGVMTKHLQDRYPEYTRRKNTPFRQLVEQAYRIVSESYGMGSQPSSGDDSDGSDLELMDDSSPNMMNSMMNNLYNKLKTGAQAKPSEAIDISSDESGDETRPNGRSILKGDTGPFPSKSFREVSISQVASSEPATVASVEPSAPSIQKRHEVVDTGGHPSKKRKLNKTVKTMEDQGKEQEPQRNNSAFSPNSNESSGLSLSQSSPYQQQQVQTPQIQSSQQQSQRARKYKKEVQLRTPRESFQDVGGMEKTLKELCEILMHINVPDIYFELGLMPPRGILLHGPPGCGKTLLARAIAGQVHLTLIEVPATELIGGVSGESEERIREVFEQAMSNAPCVLFIDEVDSIAANRSTAQKDMERRMVSQLISCFDNLKLNESGQSVLVIGATTRPDVLDPALRRVGRFDHEIAIGIPSRKDRKDILTIMCDTLSMEPRIDLDKIAELTPGYVGADLLALTSRAATIAVKRKWSEQMRAFQLKRNITIVDLDDETEEGSSADSPKKKSGAVVGTKVVDANVAKPVKDKSPIGVKSIKEKKLPEKQAPIPNAKATDGSEVDGLVAADESLTELMDVDAEPTDTVAQHAASEDNVSPEKQHNDTVIGNDALADKAGDAAEPEADTTPREAAIPAAVVETVLVEVVSAEEPDKKEESAVVAPKAVKEVIVGEPSLFELLNWLENPPEDMNFVSNFCITLNDMCEAVKVTQPSAKREGFITVPDVTWDDVGSLQDIREELKLAVLAPVKFPAKLEHLGLSAPSGVLLCGPPGCGKTLLAKAIANEAGINFISVKGPELMNMYVGESERAVRACFQRARNSAPCVVFFDEFDSLCPKRSEGNESGSGTRVVNQLLTEMDGVEDRKGVYILAASNRPDIIDPAILRPGRLDTILYVGLPEKNDRVEILKATTKNGTRPVISEDVSFEELAAQTEGYTGADLAGLLRQASMLALKESIHKADDRLENLFVRKEHFDRAIKMLRPSVTAQDRKVYERLRLKYAAPRAVYPEKSLDE